MDRPNGRINCCTFTKIRINYLCTFGSAASTGKGNRLFQQIEENKNCVISAIGLAELVTGKVYTYLIGCFQYMLILYTYDTNSILVELIKTRSDTYMLRSYDFLYNTL